MIDFHTHILPCMDDGSQSISESLSMLRAEARQGIEGVVQSGDADPRHAAPAGQGGIARALAHIGI